MAIGDASPPLRPTHHLRHAELRYYEALECGDQLDRMEAVKEYEADYHSPVRQATR